MVALDKTTVRQYPDGMKALMHAECALTKGLKQCKRGDKYGSFTGCRKGAYWSVKFRHTYDVTEVELALSYKTRNARRA